MKAAKLSSLMVRGEIQRKKKCSRSRSLMAAWVIMQHEEITVYYLVRRHSHDRYQNRVSPADGELFPAC